MEGYDGVRLNMGRTESVCVIDLIWEGREHCLGWKTKGHEKNERQKKIQMCIDANGIRERKILVDLSRPVSRSIHIRLADSLR